MDTISIAASTSTRCSCLRNPSRACPLPDQLCCPRPWAAELIGRLTTPFGNPFYTIGHSTRTTPEFVDLLCGATISFVVNVRTVPRSRTNPLFNCDALSDSLALYQIKTSISSSLAGCAAGSVTPSRPERLLGENKLPELCRLRPDRSVQEGHSLMCRCPRCGKGRLFNGILTFAPRCEVCSLDFSSPSRPAVRPFSS